MSILDTFFLMFEGNAEGAKKAAAEAIASGEHVASETVKQGETAKKIAHEVEESNSKLAESFDKVKEHAHELTETLIEHALEVAAAFQALFAVEKLVDNFFEQAETSDKLGETARQIGVNVEQLDQWGQAVKRVGGTAEGFEGSLKAVEFRMQRIALAAAAGKAGGDRSARFFKALGIDPSDAKDIFHLLEEIPKKIEGMDKGKSNALLKGIGLDDGTIRLLQSGNKEVEELLEKQRRLGSITAEDAETAERFNREWMDVKELFRNITVDLDTEFLPILQSLLEGVEAFVEFLRDHKDLVVGFFIGLAAAAIIAGEAFGVLGAIMGFVFSPVVLITATIVGLIAVFALLYDDIVNFAEGNNSIIGELAKRWPIVGEAVWLLINVFKHLWAAIETGASAVIGVIEKIPEGFEQWKEIIGSVVDWIKSVFETLPEPIKAVFEGIQKVAEAAFDSLPSVLKYAFDTMIADLGLLKDVFAAGFHFIANLVTDPKHAFQNLFKELGEAWDVFVGKIPALAKEFEDVKNHIKVIVDEIVKFFLDMWSKIGGIFDKIASVGSGIGGLVHKGIDAVSKPFGQATDGPQPIAIGAIQHIPHDVAAGIAAGQGALSDAQSPLMAQTPQSLSAGSGPRAVTNQINASVGSITINTQATDATGIKADLDSHLADHYKSVLSTFGDGVTH